MRKRIVFFAPHLLSPTVGSGGDILFCEIARRIRDHRPEWEVCVVAPDFACSELARYFERTMPFRSGAGEGRQGSPASVLTTWLKRLPVAHRVLIEAQPDLVHSTGDFFVDVWPVVFARRSRAFAWSGVVHHVNAPPWQRRNSFGVSAVSYVLQRASFVALRRADSISVLNRGVLAQLCDLGFSRSRIHVVGAGIDVEKFPQIGTSLRERRAVWLNRLEPTKGIFDLPAIMRYLPRDMAIDVVGRGPQVHVERLRGEIETAGVAQRCVLHGFLPDEELRRVLSRAGVFISCSYEEGWGISIAEALAMGLPCVVYDLPSHREIFGDAITRVPIGDTRAFAGAIADHIEQLESDAVRQTRHDIARAYSIEECAARQEEIFAKLIGEMSAV
jgi:glycosyltransferase involved in cell wall biosynthesis